mmetsp:Transcript_5719/g.13680  ORF Transcript_5719/g.13680 Transcript_5719/m.13680 type:complete len:219 (-) Transcript_5719:939-1595(-)
MFFENNFFRFFWCVNNRRVSVQVHNARKPVLKLHGISDCSTECQHGTVTRLNNSLESISFWSIKGVYLIENEIVKHTETSIENHEFTLSLSHFISSNTTNLGQASFQSKRSSDVNLGFTSYFLEGDLFGTNSNISLEELVVKGGNLPHQDFTGKNKEDGPVCILTGVGTQNGFTRRCGGTNNSRFSVVNGLEDIKLPWFELELSVVSTEWGKTIRHLG